MSIKVRVPTAITKGATGSDNLNLDVANLPELLAKLESLYPGVKASLLDEKGNLNRFVNIYVNDEDIRFLGGDKYAFQDGDEVLLIPSIAGGAS